MKRVILVLLTSSKNSQQVSVTNKVATITAEKFFKPKFPASFKPAKVKGMWTM